MLKASEIMTRDVATIKYSATVAEAVKLMKLKKLRALVVENRNWHDAYGIITHHDVVTKVVAFGKDLNKIKAHEIMRKPCIVVNPDLGVEYVARLFAETGIKVAPVIRGELLGIISESDILYKGDFLENPKLPLLQRKLAEAISQAKTLAKTKGATSTECLEAIAEVDEIEAETAYQEGVPSPEKTAFQLFCEQYPEILELRHQQILSI